MSQFSYKDKKNHARLLILNYITNFCLTRSYGDDPRKYGSLHSFLDQRKPLVGDLVSLKSAPNTKYYLSWYVGLEYSDPGGFDVHLLESIEDGELCNWSNVGLEVLERDEVASHPEWRWSDRQFEFKNKWFRACKRRDAFITLPCYPDFKPDGSVVLATRKRYGFGDGDTRTFENWKKVLVREMLEFYDYSDKKKDETPS